MNTIKRGFSSRAGREIEVVHAMNTGHFEWNAVSVEARERFLAQESREWARWSGRFADDPNASTMLRSHPALPLTSHETLRARTLAQSDAKTRVDVSYIAGEGLFAEEPIRAGDRIAAYSGRVRVFSDARALMAASSETALQYHPYDSTCFAFVEGAAGHASKINHCDAPSAAWWWIRMPERWMSVVVALRSITPGEEITLDYGPGFLKRRGIDPR